MRTALMTSWSSGLSDLMALNGRVWSLTEAVRSEFLNKVNVLLRRVSPGR
jgi:hypothetical protein